MRSSDYSPKEVAVFRAVLTLAGRGVNLTEVKMQQIADAAGMGKGTLYEYFTSKEQLLTDTVNWCVLHELETVTALPAEAADFDQLVQLTADYIEQLVTQRAVAYEMLAVVQHRKGPPGSGEVSELEQSSQQLIHAETVRAYELARRTMPLAEDLDADFFGYMLFSAILGYASTLFRDSMNGRLTDERRAKHRGNFVRMVKKCLQ